MTWNLLPSTQCSSMLQLLLLNMQQERGCCCCFAELLFNSTHSVKIMWYYVTMYRDLQLILHQLRKKKKKQFTKDIFTDVHQDILEQGGKFA